MSNGNFANGLIVKKPHQNAPPFVKCRLSFKVAEFIQCLQQNNNNGWVNMDVKLAQDNVKLYAEIDDWQPNQQPQQRQQYPQQQQNQGYQQQQPQQQYQQPAPPQQQYQQPQQDPQQPQGEGYGPPMDDIPF